MSKNNSGTNPKKGKSLAKPNPNPASVDLFSDEALAEAVTVPNSLSSETAEIVDVLDDDSVKDADFEPSKERETESDDDSEGEDETDINKSPLVKKVTKSVKAAMKEVPELHPADNKLLYQQLLLSTS